MVALGGLGCRFSGVWVAVGRNGWVPILAGVGSQWVAAPVYMLAAWRLDAARPSGELSID